MTIRERGRCSAGADAVFLMPVALKRIGAFGRHYLVPIGEPVGALGIAVKLIRLAKRAR
jgi:hypothetical protein